MNLKQFAKNITLSVAGLLLAGSAIAAPIYSFRIYAPGLCPEKTCSSASVSTPPSTDPYWADVVSLLHMDGAQGSSTFTDQVGNAFSSSGPTLSTTTSISGGSSGAFTGSSAIQATATNDWNLTGDFTIEGFVNFNTLGSSDTFTPSDQYIFDIGQNSTFFRWYYATGWDFYGPGVTWIATCTTVPQPNQWYYWVVQRKSSTVSIFLNGSLCATGTYTGTMGGQSTTMTYGDFGGGENYGLQGNLDEIRVTNGVARYSTSAPVPTSFPNN